MSQCVALSDAAASVTDNFITFTYQSSHMGNDRHSITIACDSNNKFPHTTNAKYTALPSCAVCIVASTISHHSLQVVIQKKNLRTVNVAGTSMNI